MARSWRYCWGSDGAVVALLVAQRRPELVGHMVLIGQYYNSSGRMPGSDLDRRLHSEQAKNLLRQRYCLTSSTHCS